MRRALLVPVFLLAIAAFPVNRGLVTDDAHILTTDEEVALEQKLRAFEQKTSVEMAVVTVLSLDGMSIDEYRVKLFETWKIGKKGKDNGVLLIFAPNEPPSGKVGIEVGYGLEPLLPDSVTGQIARERIRPGWRSTHRANGVIAGVDAIIERLSQAPPEAATQIVSQPQSSDDAGIWIFFLLLLAIAIPIGVYLVIRARRASREEEEHASRIREELREEARNWTPPYQGNHFTPPSGGTVVQRRPHRVEPEPSRSESVYEPTPYVAPEPTRYESPSYSAPDTSSSFDFGGGSSGGGGSSNDL
jgi:uncharacterized protein